MSIREHLRQRRRKWTIVFGVGIALFAGGGFVCSQTNNPWLLPIPLIGFALFGLGGFARSFGLSCPKCGGAIGLATPYFSNPFGIDFRFAPHVAFLSIQSSMRPKRSNQAMQLTAVSFAINV